MGCCIHPVFLIPQHHWLVESSWIFFSVVGLQFWCCVWPAFCWGGHVLFGCMVCMICMQSRGVYHWSWRSVLPVPWFVVSVEGRIRCPWRRWWENSKLGDTFKFSNEKSDKHTAALSTVHKADRATALQISSVSQPCARGIVTSRIWRCVEPHKNGLLMAELT